MDNYSYTEIQDMQKKAMERVREMKRNSDIVTQSAQRDLDGERQNDYVQQPIITKVTNMPPNFPKETSYPSFKNVFYAEKEKSHIEKQVEKTQIKDERKSTIENLFAEPDKALILGLIMLLKSEKADEALIMALSYILS